MLLVLLSCPLYKLDSPPARICTVHALTHPTTPSPMHTDSNTPQPHTTHKILHPHVITYTHTHTSNSPPPAHHRTRLADEQRAAIARELPVVAQGDTDLPWRHGGHAVARDAPPGAAGNSASSLREVWSMRVTAVTRERAACRLVL